MSLGKKQGTKRHRVEDSVIDLAGSDSSGSSGDDVQFLGTFRPPPLKTNVHPDFRKGDAVAPFAVAPLAGGGGGGGSGAAAPAAAAVTGPVDELEDNDDDPYVDTPTRTQFQQSLAHARQRLQKLKAASAQEAPFAGSESSSSGSEDLRPSDVEINEAKRASDKLKLLHLRNARWQRRRDEAADSLVELQRDLKRMDEVSPAYAAAHRRRRHTPAPAREVVGRGSFGCVVDPLVPCHTWPEGWSKRHDVPRDGSSLVGKLMTSYDSAIQEHEADQAIVQRVDPDGAFTVHVLGRCAVRPALSTLQGCDAGTPYSKYQDSRRNKAQGYIGQLIMRRGGISLRQLKDQRARFRTPADVVTVLRSAASVVRGLSALAAAKVAHRDVSDGNILYDTNTRPPVMRLIDFGVSKPFAHVYQTPSGSEQVQFNYPPEFAFTSTGSIGPVVKADNGLKTWYQWEDDITNESGPNVFTIPARTRARCTRLALQLQQAQDPRDTSWQAAAVGKFDTYGLGVSLHVFLLGAARTVPALQAASRDPAPPWVADVCRILMGMTHPNFEERLGPEEAWTAWQRLRW